MVISHNLMAMNTQRQFNMSIRRNKKSMEKTASGYKINRSADDAAGLSISEKMRNQIRGLDQAVSNIEDGISFIQTAEGTLNEVHNILQRIGELSIKASNDTYAQQDRGFINDEVTELKEELSEILKNSNFNNQKFYDSLELMPTTKSSNEMISVKKTYSPSFKKFESREDMKEFFINNKKAFDGVWEVSAGSGYMQLSYTIKEHIEPQKTENNNANNSGNLDSNSSNKDDSSNQKKPMIFQKFSASIDLADYKDMFVKGYNGWVNMTEDYRNYPEELEFYNKLNLPKTNIHLNLNAKYKKFTPSKEDLKDTDINQYNAELDAFVMQCINSINASGLYEADPSPYAGTVDHPIYNNKIFQVGANAGETFEAKWKNLNIDSLGIAMTNTVTHEDAQSAISEVQRAIKIVSGERSNFGAIQNRMDSILRNNQNYAENLQNAESKIRDTDMNTELVEQAKTNILQQVNEAMLAQANKNNENILNIL